ncbi:unnamed protein product [Jaminaea pallidilutea]
MVLRPSLYSKSTSRRSIVRIRLILSTGWIRKLDGIGSLEVNVDPLARGLELITTDHSTSTTTLTILTTLIMTSTTTLATMPLQQLSENMLRSSCGTYFIQWHSVPVPGGEVRFYHEVMEQGASPVANHITTIQIDGTGYALVRVTGAQWVRTLTPATASVVDSTILARSLTSAVTLSEAMFTPSLVMAPLASTSPSSASPTSSSRSSAHRSPSSFARGSNGYLRFPSIRGPSEDLPAPSNPQTVMDARPFQDLLFETMEDATRAMLSLLDKLSLVPNCQWNTRRCANTFMIAKCTSFSVTKVYLRSIKELSALCCGIYGQGPQRTSRAEQLDQFLAKRIIFRQAAK